MRYIAFLIFVALLLPMQALATLDLSGGAGGGGSSNSITGSSGGACTVDDATGAIDCEPASGQNMTVQLAGGGVVQVDSEGSAGVQEIILGLSSDTSNRPILQFSETGTISTSAGMSIEYNGVVNDLRINDLTGSPVAIFESGGDVGFGVAPTVPLQVSSEGSAGVREIVIGVQSNTSNRPIIQFSELSSVSSSAGFAIEYNGVANNLSFNNLSNVPVVTMTDEENIGVGVSAPGGSSTTGTKVLGLGNGTEPLGAVANQISLYSVDSSDGATNATLGLLTEQTVETATCTIDSQLQIVANGVNYNLPLCTIP